MEGRCGLFLVAVVLCSFITLTSGSLYNNTDDVVLLDLNNFYSTVLGTENAWVIEFYSSWCGHCINFAPIWKLFATDVRDWQHTIKVGVLDCAVDAHLPICREYEVQGYPTMRLFAAKPTRGNYGMPMHSRGLETLKESVIDFLVEEQQANNGSTTWVNLQPYEGSLEQVLEFVPVSAKHIVVIVDHSASYIPESVALDLGGYKEIAVVIMKTNMSVVEGIETGPNASLVYIDRNGKQEVVSNAAETREELTAMVMEKFNLTRDMLPFSTYSPIVDEEEGVTGDKRTTNGHLGRDKENQVYLVDIENTVSYTLRNEVVQNKVIEGEALKALGDFLEVLVFYLPTRPAINKFLSGLYEFVTSQGESITGEQLSDAINSLQNVQSVLPHHQPWIGCLGSEAKYRGYPCGLWTTFHTLTVNALLQDENGSDPLKTLRAIHGYVKNFFSCTYCSQHFDKMYREDAESSVNSTADSVLWLWRGHNKVNNRLMGDESEDPDHPKVAYPSQVDCPSCWDGDAFNEEGVLAYLKDIYSQDSISLRGAQTFESAARNKQAKVTALIEQDRKGITIKYNEQPLNSFSYTIIPSLPLILTLSLLSSLICVRMFYKCQ